MKVNKWTLGLAAVGMVSLPSIMLAEEKPSPVMTALSSTTLSGYVSTSAQWNPGTGNAQVPGFAFGPGKQDGFNLDVVKLTIERPLDEAQWAAGYKADLWLGPDANAFNTLSHNSAVKLAGGNNSDLAIKQAYVALRAPVGNGLDFKLGVWDTIIGYETADGPGNPNYTRSYGFTLEPTTHTGLQINYQVSPAISLAAGIANTYGPTIQERANPPKSESHKTYMGAISLTAPDSFGALKGATLYGCIINGINTAIRGGNSSQQNYYVGATVPTPVTGLKVGVSYDYAGVSHDSDLPPPNGSLWANAASLYASWQATEKLSLHTRAEYFWQSHDQATITSPANTGSDPVGVLPAKVFALTETLQYDLWKNVLSRLEFRWDHAAAGQDAYGGNFNPGGPPVTGDKKNVVLIAANLVYKF